MAQDNTAHNIPAVPTAPLAVQANPSYLSEINNITQVSVGDTRPEFSKWHLAVDGGAPAIYPIAIVFLIILILLRQGKSHDA